MNLIEKNHFLFYNPTLFFKNLQKGARKHMETSPLCAKWAWWFGAEASGPCYQNQRMQNLTWENLLRTHGLHYGGAVIEGIRRYEAHTNAQKLLGKGKPGYIIFRLKDHIARLVQSAELYGFGKMQFTHQNFIEGCKGIAQLNNDACYIRPIIFRAEGMGIRSPMIGELQCLNAAIVSEPWGKYLSDGLYNNGVKIDISDWRKPSPEQLPVQAKGSANYVVSTIVKNLAIQRGLAEMLIRHPDGKHVSEGTGMNFVMVKGNTLITPDASSGRLNGITLRTILKIALDQGFEVEKRNVSIEEVLDAQECFFCGTATEVTPITMIKGKPVGNGFAGDTTKNLAEIYSKVVTGEITKYHDWCDFVPKTITFKKNAKIIKDTSKPMQRINPKQVANALGAESFDPFN